MNIIELSALIQDERKCEDYLRQVGILKTFKNCIRCGSEKLGIIRRNRYKCYKCKAEWSTFRDSFLITTNIECSKFLMTIKLFEIGVNTSITAYELNITQKIAGKIYSYIRNCLSGEIPNVINSRIIMNDAPLFNIVSLQSNIRVGIESDHKNITEALIIATRRTDYGKNVFYDFSCRYKSDLKKSSKSQSCYSGEINRFWSYALDRLRFFNGTTVENYYIYLKEIEFRYNNRNTDLFNILITKLQESNVD